MIESLKQKLIDYNFKYIYIIPPLGISYSKKPNDSWLTAQVPISNSTAENWYSAWPTIKWLIILVRIAEYYCLVWPKFCQQSEI